MSEENKSTISSLKSSEKTETILTGAVEKVEKLKKDYSFLFSTDSTNLLAKFYACQSERVECSFDITDNYVEDNSAIHDHIGVKPLTFRLQGKIGDVAYPYNETTEDVITSLYVARLNAEEVSVETKIATVLTPTLTNYMSAAMAAYDFVADNVKGIAETLTKIGVMAYNTTKINNFLSKSELGKKALKSLKDWQNEPKKDQFYTGERAKPKTPKRVLDYILSNASKPLTLINDMGEWENLYITNAYLEQKESRYTGDVVVELKQLRYTEVKITKIDYKQYATRYAQQRAAETDSGTINGKKELISTEYKETVLGEKS